MVAPEAAKGCKKAVFGTPTWVYVGLPRTIFVSGCATVRSFTRQSTRTMQSSRFVLILSASVATASALPRAANAADSRAEALYQEGRRAAEAKDWALACEKFKSSLEREAAPGTLLNLADCEENRGQLVLALTHFEAASRTYRSGDARATYAKDRAAAVEKRVAKLTIRLPAANTTSTVECDGVRLDPAHLGIAMPVDPGDHVIVFHMPARPDAVRSVRLAPGESRDVEIILESADGAPAPSITIAPAPQKNAPSNATSPPNDTSDSSPLRTAGYVSLGIGGVALGIGVLGGLMTMSAKNAADAHCPTTGCDGEGSSAQDRGKTWSNVGTVGFVVGGVGLLTGAGILLLAPSRNVGVVSAHPTASGSEIRWTGTF